MQCTIFAFHSKAQKRIKREANKYSTHLYSLKKISILESRIGPVQEFLDRIESRKFFSPILLDRLEPNPRNVWLGPTRIMKIWNRSMPSVNVPKYFFCIPIPPEPLPLTQKVSPSEKKSNFLHVQGPTTPFEVLLYDLLYSDFGPITWAQKNP